MVRPFRSARLSSLVICILAAAGPTGYAQTGKSPETQNAAASDGADEPVIDIGPGVTPPRVTRQVSPAHPDSGGFRISGTVVIALVVSSHGEPKAIRVIKSLDKEIDESAVAAVKQWSFEPAKKDGKPVAVRVSVEVRFHDM
jgi:protein TonB